MSDAVGGRGIYSIGAVSRMLGLTVVTIRNWEDRYAAVVPERSAGGQRLYSQEQVEQLRFIAAEVARGLSAADAHRLLAERAPAATSASIAPAAGTDDRSRPLVLLAERDPVAAQPVQSVLKREGYDVEPVYAASVAESLWLERRPQLAIVELMISGGQGAELCRRLKQHDTGAVLASSSLAAHDEAIEAGADAFLQKPIDPVELVATVNDLLTARRKAA